MPSGPRGSSGLLAGQDAVDAGGGDVEGGGDFGDVHGRAGFDESGATVGPRFGHRKRYGQLPSQTLASVA